MQILSHLLTFILFQMHMLLLFYMKYKTDNNSLYTLREKKKKKGTNWDNTR